MRARKSWRKKLKQEKRALYLQGLMDSQDGLGRRWERHEHMEHYERGYQHGLQWFPGSEPPAPATAGLDEFRQGMEKFAEWLVRAMSGRASQ